MSHARSRPLVLVFCIVLGVCGCVCFVHVRKIVQSFHLSSIPEKKVSFFFLFSVFARDTEAQEKRALDVSSDPFYLLNKTLNPPLKEREA